MKINFVKLTLHLNMRMKIFLTFLTANLIIILLISSLFYQKTTEFFNEQYAHSLSERLYIGTKNVDKAFWQVYRLCTSLAFEPGVRRLAEHSSDADSLEQLHDVLHQARLRDDLIDNIYCYLPDSHQLVRSDEFRSVYRLDNQTAKMLTDIIDSQQGMQPLSTKDILTASAKNIYLYKTPVIDEKGRTIAYIICTVSERSLYYKYLDDIIRGGTSLICMFDAQRQLVSTSYSGGSSLPHSLESDASAYGDMAIGDADYLSVWHKAPFSGYFLQLAVDKRTFLAKLIALQMLVIACSIVILILSAAAIYYIALRLNRPVEDLACAMKAASRGNLDVKAPVHGKDEIGYLAVRFNYMISRIKNLVDDLAAEKAKKKEAELNALQYQIRPHFIYNTLNSIRFAALMQGAKNISSLLANFIDLLQVSTSRKGSFAPLSEEISTLKNYIALQEFRLPDSFSADFIIAPETVDCFVPRLILQPLVENSILHGPSEQKPFCRIIVRSYIKNDALYLEIEDDGCGINQMQIESLTEPAKKTSGGYSGIGVFNIRERLRLYYGTRGSLRYFSDSCSYTKAQIKLPISHNIDEYKI